jgi:hypothetical protein
MKGNPIARSTLHKLYTVKRFSAAEIAQQLHCSTNKVHYWLARRGIKMRTQSDASYVKHNPTGDPFMFRPPQNMHEVFLMGLGIGLYWGEGNKKNKTAVRLGNTDPRLIKAFLHFLNKIYGVERYKIRFGLQVFSDMKPRAALKLWSRTIGFPTSHFGKVIVTPARSIGTYREKTKHGVLTVYVSNTKLRNLLIRQIENLADSRYYR